MQSCNRRHFLRFSGTFMGVAAMGSLVPMAALAKISNFQTDTAESRRRRRFVNVELVTHENRKVRFYDDLIKDKIILINFIYANCRNEGLCPMMTYNLRRVQEMLDGRVGKDIFMYSVTLEPEHDTPEVLRKYMQQHDVKPGWQFLTGTKDNIEVLRRNLGFAFADPELDKDKQQHIGIVKYGIEPLERWGTCPVLTKPEGIVGYLEWMDPKGKRPA